MIGPDGKPLTFEILLKGKPRRAGRRRLAADAGEARHRRHLRSVDSAQYLQRQLNYDFDAMLINYTSSLSPGVEQVSRWGSASRDARHLQFCRRRQPGRRRHDRRSSSTPRTRTDFVEAVRAYDRVLLSGAYVVPLYFQARTVGRALGAYQTSRKDAYIRLSAADLVARGQTDSARKDVANMANAIRSRSTWFPTSSARGASSARSGWTRRSAKSPTVDVEVRWRPFQLDPTIPPEGKDRKRYMLDKFGSEERIRADPRPCRGDRRGRRHRLRLRRHQGCAEHARRAPRHPLGRRCRRATCRTAWCGACSSSISRKAQNIGDHAVLIEAAREAGMDASVVEACCHRRRSSRPSRPRSPPPQRMGVTGVPCFLLEGKYAVMGAQEAAMLADAIRQVAAAKARGELEKAS